ncbi:hypothetical protein D3C85_1269010 [compost metagenome]
MQKPEQDPAPEISPVNNFYAIPFGRYTATDALREFAESAVNSSINFTLIYNHLTTGVLALWPVIISPVNPSRGTGIKLRTLTSPMHL